MPSKGDSPFYYFEWHNGPDNLLFPYYKKEKRRLTESGLTKMWDNLYRISYLLRQCRKSNISGQNIYFKAVQYSYGNIKEPVTFHESHPVSVNLFLPVFSICAVLIGAGIVGLIIENRKAVTNFAKITVRRVRQCCSRMRGILMACRISKRRKKGGNIKVQVLS